ncbi:hypothetical protein RUM43_014799 [Polyplax serrata]|uniref:Uncharacterized protein n=1 Tax=Polyplax serrata TaxID=468196 RepID=A0AAN8NWE0_POLSC
MRGRRRRVFHEDHGAVSDDHRMRNFYVTSKKHAVKSEFRDTSLSKYSVEFENETKLKFKECEIKTKLRHFKTEPKSGKSVCVHGGPSGILEGCWEASKGGCQPTGCRGTN